MILQISESKEEMLVTGLGSSLELLGVQFVADVGLGFGAVGGPAPVGSCRSSKLTE